MENLQILMVHTPFNWKRPLTIISHLIRKVTCHFFNHGSVRILLEGKWFIVESDIKGVILIPYEDWVKEQIVDVWIPPNAHEIEAANLPFNNKTVRQRLLSKVGKTKYDFLSLFWFMLVYKLTGKFYGFTSERKATKTLYCFEYIAWAFGYKEWFKVDGGAMETALKENSAWRKHNRIHAKELL